MRTVELGAATITGRPGDAPGVTVYRGIRYGRAARFEPPEPVELRGAIDASEFGPAAPQLPASESVPGDVTPAAMDEDCLFLNVWTPDAPGPHPVFVWIYGGGFLTGATSDPTIDGSRLARRGPMVVVTVGYRLGALGFLGVGARNCGLLDQECALGWIQRHIAAFGGDPARVTIAGESAGGGSALHLLAAPRTVGRFGRAIVQSGATDYTRTLDEVGRVTEVVLEALDGDDPRAVPWPRIIEAQGRTLLPLLMEMARMPFHPCVDDDLLPARPADALAAGVGADVDLLIGTTEDEMRLFLVEPSLVDVQMRKRVDRYLGRDGGDVVEAYRAIVGDDPMDLWAAIFTDREMLLPALAMADAHRGPTFRYLFTWPVTSRADGLPRRACHASDLPFTFDALDRLDWAAWSAADGDRRPAADALVETMTDAWCRFVATGNPGWPAYESGRVQVLGPECVVADDPSAARRAVWAADA
jgi:para-nitrobenzyl esterase